MPTYSEYNVCALICILFCAFPAFGFLTILVDFCDLGEEAEVV